jgi:predicted RNase H-like nuclease (RuvC/YqgF family)
MEGSNVEGLPPWLSWMGSVALAVVALILGSKLLSTITEQLFGKKKSDAETEGLRLANLNAAIKTVESVQRKSDDQQKKINEQMAVISELKEAKIEDDRKIARRDGVIEEQRLELRSLHTEVAEMRVEIRDLKDRMAAVELENKELVKENAQLKGMNEHGC